MNTICRLYREESSKYVNHCNITNDFLINSCLLPSRSMITKNDPRIATEEDIENFTSEFKVW